MIEKDSVDMSSMLQTLSGNQDTKEYKDGKIHSVNIMGDMFETMSQEVKHNDSYQMKNQ